MTAKQLIQFTIDHDSELTCSPYSLAEIYNNEVEVRDDLSKQKYLSMLTKIFSYIQVELRARRTKDFINHTMIPKHPTATEIAIKQREAIEARRRELERTWAEAEQFQKTELAQRALERIQKLAMTQPPIYGIAPTSPDEFTIQKESSIL